MIPGQDQKEDPTVLILGDGPAGVSAALALHRQGVKVWLSGIKDKSSFKIGESLPPEAPQILEALGVLHCLEQSTPQRASGALSCWGSADVATADYADCPERQGWILNRSKFEKSLKAAAEEQGVPIVKEFSATKIHREQLFWRVGEHRIPWIVDATGRAGHFARTQGSRREFDNKQICIYALFHQEHGRPPDTDTRTLVESAPNGWWYSALLPEGRRFIAYYTDADIVPRRHKEREGFLALLEHSRVLSPIMKMYGYEMGSELHISHAQNSRRLPVYGNGWIAAGDAAVAIDPIASQGMHNALITGATAADYLTLFLQGHTQALEDYHARINEIYFTYLQTVNAAYQQEQRWADQAYWQRRHAGSSAHLH